MTNRVARQIGVSNAAEAFNLRQDYQSDADAIVAYSCNVHDTIEEAAQRLVQGACRVEQRHFDLAKEAFANHVRKLFSAEAVEAAEKRGAL